MDRPYVVEPATEFQGGAVHDNIIEDAVTRTELDLKTGGPIHALLFVPDLKYMAKHGGYRAHLAKQMIHRVYREAAVAVVKEMLR